MRLDMPQAVSTYFTAADARDVPAMVGAFTETAIVKDEGHAHHGRAAIRRWIEETLRKYDYRVEPTDVAEVDGETVVTGIVSGTFPGSPITLRHAFTIEDGGIARLEIG